MSKVKTGLTLGAAVTVALGIVALFTVGTWPGVSEAIKENPTLFKW